VKAGGADHALLTTSVEQITLVLKAGAGAAAGRKVITTGGSSSPSQLIKQAGAAAEGTYHSCSSCRGSGGHARRQAGEGFVDEWAKRGHPFEG